MEIPAVRLDPDLPLPAYARAGDAGMDLLAREGGTVVRAGGRAVFPTGIVLEIPPGRAGLVLPRSGLALRHGITCMNSPGLVDSGYRDELRVILLNTDPHDDFTVERGDRIAQLVIISVDAVTLVEVHELGTSERGLGGFGSTGRR